MAKRGEFGISDFYCTKCGNKGIALPRSQGKSREKGHLKRLYCVHCKETVNHVEVKECGRYTYQDFKAEFEGGKFVERDGERVRR